MYISGWMPRSYPPDVLADDGLALINWLRLDDYDLGGYSLGARIVPRMLVRGVGPAHAIVAGQGLDALDRTTSRAGRHRRVLSALTHRGVIERGSPDEELPSARFTRVPGNHVTALTSRSSSPRSQRSSRDILTSRPQERMRPSVGSPGCRVAGRRVCLAR